MIGEGVSFVIPVHDGESHLEEVLEAVLSQDGPGPIEVIVVDDGSTDGSGTILERYGAEHGVRVLAGAGRGSAAALNLGVEAARHPRIAQVDQDVVVAPGWLEGLLAALHDPAVAAAQGRYVAAPDASIWARIMALDLAQRYRGLAAFPGPCGEVDHVSTGNTVYRTAALRQVGGFDESLGYGSDNDLSYRLGAAGFRLAICREVLAVHYWRDNALGYWRQQYGQGYGRLDLVMRHPRRVGGDDVSGLGMMLHAPVTLLAVAALVATPVLAVLLGPWRITALGSTSLLGVLAVERLIAGLRSFAASGDRAALAFAPVHLLRDLAWAAAIVVWSVRRLLGRRRRPRHSMPR